MRNRWFVTFGLAGCSLAAFGHNALAAAPAQTANHPNILLKWDK